VIESHLEVSWQTIIFPVGDAITNDHALHIWYPSIRVSLLCLIYVCIEFT
jgi:hypothetical protein